MKKTIVLVLMSLMAGMVSAQLRRPSGMLDRLRNHQNGGLQHRGQQQQEQQAAGDLDSQREKLKNVPKGTNGVPALAFTQAPVELVLEAYGAQVGKTIIPAPDLPKATITLNSLEGQTLERDEYLQAIEVALTLNGIVLQPRGEKFLQAFARKTVRTQGIPLGIDMPKDGLLPEGGRVVSQMIRLHYITTEEAQKAIEGFKDPNGLFQVFERTNSILVTDTQENVNRMLQIVKLIDVPTPVLEDVFTRQIKFATAADIKTALETIVTESQKENQKESGPKTTGAPGFASHNAPTTSRLLNLNRRPGQQQEAAPTPNATLTATISDADRGMIRGKVLILSDERSNKLIIITMKSNMDFFDRVIETLDVETEPEFKVEVVRLKYAEAEDVESMLNDLIGGTSSSGSKENKNQNAKNAGNTKGNLTQRGGTKPQVGSTNKGNVHAGSVGDLTKENCKVLADKRINGIVVMTRKELMPIILSVIDDMDVKLSQVLLETVIIQVELGDKLKTGLDWVQRGREKVTTTEQAKDALGQNLFYKSRTTTITKADGSTESSTKILSDVVPNGFSSSSTTVGEDGSTITYSDSASSVGVYRHVSDVVRDSFVNNNNYMLGAGGGSGSSTLQTLMSVGTNVAASSAWGGANPIAQGGLSYFLKSDKLNIAAVIQASKSDSRTKVLASPILMTVDNKEATIEATDMIYLFSGYQYSGSSMYGSQVRNYEKRDIGLVVKVTPKINPNGTVMLTIEETIESQGADQNVPNESGGTDPYATVVTRKMSSDVSVENRQTIIMGGLTKTTKTNSETGIPILKDIPYIGKWLFGSVETSDARSELLVFITPYVLDDAEASQAEALRRKKALSDPRPWEDNGWSASPLADPVSKKEQLRRFQDEWAKQDEERKTKIAIEKARIDRAKKLKDMTKDERQFWIDLHKEELDKEEKEMEKEAFEKRIEGEKDQEALRALVEKLKKDKMTKADKEITDADKSEKNEYRKYIEQMEKDGKSFPAGPTLKQDAQRVKKENEEAAAAIKKAEEKDAALLKKVDEDVAKKTRAKTASDTE